MLSFIINYYISMLYINYNYSVDSGTVKYIKTIIFKFYYIIFKKKTKPTPSFYTYKF